MSLIPAPVSNCASTPIQSSRRKLLTTIAEPFQRFYLHCGSAFGRNTEGLARGSHDMRSLNRCASNKTLQPTPSRFAGWGCSVPLLAAHLRVGSIIRSGWLSLTLGSINSPEKEMRMRRHPCKPTINSLRRRQYKAEFRSSLHSGLAICFRDNNSNASARGQSGIASFLTGQRSVKYSRCNLHS